MQTGIMPSRLVALDLVGSWGFLESTAGVLGAQAARFLGLPVRRGGTGGSEGVCLSLSLPLWRNVMARGRKALARLLAYPPYVSRPRCFALCAPYGESCLPAHAYTSTGPPVFSEARIKRFCGGCTVVYHEKNEPCVCFWPHVSIFREWLGHLVGRLSEESWTRKSECWVQFCPHHTFFMFLLNILNPGWNGCLRTLTHTYFRKSFELLNFSGKASGWRLQCVYNTHTALSAARVLYCPFLCLNFTY